MKNVFPALVGCALAALSTASAGSIVVVPPVVGPPGGNTYRLIFVTSTTTDATSVDPAYYNKFVTDLAKSVPQLAALNTDWYAMANIGTTAIQDNTGYTFGPIHRLDGQWVASSLVNLYIGPLASPISIDENGNVVTGRVWTGLSGQALGGVPSSGYGELGFEWGLNAGTASSSNLYRLYAISGVIHLVPEPSSFLLLGGGICLVWVRARRVGVNCLRSRFPPEASHAATPSGR